MKFEPMVDNFLKYNTPTWHKKLSGKHRIDDIYGLGHHDRCLVGELYGMSGGYVRDTDPDYCRRCSEYSRDIWAAVTVARRFKSDYGTRFTYRDPVHRFLPDRVFHFNKVIEAWADHVKREHPEMLKQERPIAA